MYLCVCADRIRLKSFWWGVVVITQKFGDSKKNTKHDVDLQTQNSTLRCVLSSCDLCGHLYGPKCTQIQVNSTVSRPRPVKFDNLASRTLIENVKIVICTKFQKENKTSWVQGYVGACKEVHQKMWIWILNHDMCLHQITIRLYSQNNHSCQKVPWHDFNPLIGVYKSHTWP